MKPKFVLKCLRVRFEIVFKLSKFTEKICRHFRILKSKLRNLTVGKIWREKFEMHKNGKKYFLGLVGCRLKSPNLTLILKSSGTCGADKMEFR